ncbi:MAG: pyridoxamine 5'-phosphate oxidase family protein [Pseudomonadota bacterium]
MTDKLEHYQHLLTDLLQQRKTLVLATLNAEQKPEASLAPYLYYQDRFWVFVSELSNHTHNMRKHPWVSLIIHDDETQCADPFMVKRISADCAVSVVDDQHKSAILAKMQTALGDTLAVLQQLPDFHLMALSPIKGRLVVGFGKAFDVDFSTLGLSHIRPGQ